MVSALKMPRLSEAEKLERKRARDREYQRRARARKRLRRGGISEEEVQEEEVQQEQQQQQEQEQQHQQQQEQLHDEQQLEQLQEQQQRAQREQQHEEQQPEEAEQEELLEADQTDRPSGRRRKKGATTSENAKKPTEKSVHALSSITAGSKRSERKGPPCISPKRPKVRSLATTTLRRSASSGKWEREIGGLGRGLSRGGDKDD